MRISTAHSYDATIDQLSQRQSALSEAQLRLSTGKRVMRASDDPVNAARAERALASVSHATASQRSVEASRSAMTQLEGALGDAGDLLQTAREVIVQGGNATYDDGQRKVLAGQLRDLRAQLLGVANRGDGAGGYLFSGQGSGGPPFVDAAGGVQYVGTGGETSANRAEGLPMSMDGAAAWMTARTGNGVFATSAVPSSPPSGGTGWIDPGSVTDPSLIEDATYSLQFSVSAGVTTYSVLKDGAATPLTGVAFVPGQAIQIDGMAVTVNGAPAQGDEFRIVPSTPDLSVFEALDAAATDLETSMLPSNARTQATSDNLSRLDSVLARMVGSRATAGDAMNRVDTVGARLTTEVLNGQTDRSVAEDLDIVAAYTEFENLQTGYSAALQSYAAVQRMSLFDYIKA